MAPLGALMTSASAGAPMSFLGSLRELTLKPPKGSAQPTVPVLSKVGACWSIKGVEKVQEAKTSNVQVCLGPNCLLVQYRQCFRKRLRVGQAREHSGRRRMLGKGVAGKREAKTAS
jgi:hypothetical protein